ncbi:hypothetical protein M0R72_21210 [Candidatus Pacearchaeota archaeon]|jgi:hypothetical protein|nr:hypothetical protein [Candidatus Pacearchaeota archaeon]
MTYTKINFSSTTLLSARNMNHLGTIYAEGKTAIDLHTHPAVHYSQTESDALFFPIASGLDADMIDSMSYDDLLGSLIPVGGVMLYYGEDADFEDGGYLKASHKWHLSDGGTYSSTPTLDMRDYFPRCPTTITATGTGGHSTITPTGSATLGDHTLTLDEMPSHAHRYEDRYYTAVNIYDLGSSPDNSDYTTATLSTSFNIISSAVAHTHDGVTATFNSIDKPPAYMSMYFVAKVET